LASSNHVVVAREPARLGAVPGTLRQAGIALGLFVLALLPRTLAQGSFVTVDEAYHWFGRAQKFLAALQSGDYAATNLIGHPGVTTMWLGSIGLTLQRWLGALGWVGLDNPDTQRIFLRLPVGIVTALCVALAYPLLRRLFGGRVALLATLLWACDPFLIAHSQLLHTDALVTSFMTISLLAALVAFRVDEGIQGNSGTIRWPLLLASALVGGLALLTKSPSILLAPMVGLTALVTGWRSSRWSRRLPLVPLLAWGITVLAVWFALWPAAWVDLGDAIYSMYGQARYDGAVPHAWGNFFLGQAVADPGPFFYPVALAFRLTPWTLLGLLAAIGAALGRRRELPNRTALGLLTVFALVFLVMISTLAKKFDRYALPMFPALDMIAAIGLLWLAALIGRWIAARGLDPRRLVTLGWLVLISVAGANLLWFHPYEIAYYNQALGGSRTAVRAIPVGWGEGYEQVGAFISRQYDGCQRPIATWFGGTLLPYVCAPVVPLDWTFKPGAAGYSVLYIDQIQRNDVPDVTSALLGKEQPLHVVRIHGIDYAYIYRIRAQAQHPATATFGPAIQFRGYDLDSSMLRQQGALLLNLHWTAAAPVAEDLMLFIHILDERGERVAQVDVPLVGANAPLPRWQPGDYSTWKQQVPIAADLPQGNYWLALGVYRPSDFARLPLQATVLPNAPDDGNDALRLPITLP
jgi:4-amino-4-deoxy-L-arabinose transferase-like glycosyltransferase